MPDLHREVVHGDGVGMGYMGKGYIKVYEKWVYWNEVQCPQKCFKCFGHFDCSTCISLTRVFLRMYIGLLENHDQGLSVNII